jgi:hypothetical protein
MNKKDILVNSKVLEVALRLSPSSEAKIKARVLSK